MKNKRRVFLSKCFLILFLLSFPFQLGKHFWPPWSSVLGLRVDYLAPTVWISDIFLLLALAFSRKLKLDKKNYWLWFGLALAAFNIFFAANKAASFFGWLRWLRLVLAAWLVKQQKDWLRKKLPLAISFWLVVEAIFVFGQWWRQSSLGGWGWWLGERNFSLATPGVAKIIFQNRIWLRAYGTFSHPNSLAGFLLVALVILDQMKMGQQGKRLIFAVGFLSLLLTFSRTAIVVAAFYLILRETLFASAVSRKFWRWWMVWGGGTILLGVLTYILLKIFPNPLAWRQRWLLIRSAGEIFFRHPAWGVGNNNFLIVLPQHWPFNIQSGILVQPVHNLLLLVLAETGLIGLLFLLVTMKKLVVWKKKTILLWGIIFLTGLTDHYWLTLPQNILLLGLVFGLS